VLKDQVLAAWVVGALGVAAYVIVEIVKLIQGRNDGRRGAPVMPRRDSYEG
jgi:hypothetical protein